MVKINLNKSKFLLTFVITASKRPRICINWTLSEPNLFSKSTSKCENCETRFTFINNSFWKFYEVRSDRGGFQLMQILGLLGMYFDAVVVEVQKYLLFFRLALAILWVSPFYEYVPGGPPLGTISMDLAVLT